MGAMGNIMKKLFPNFWRINVSVCWTRKGDSAVPHSCGRQQKYCFPTPTPPGILPNFENCLRARNPNLVVPSYPKIASSTTSNPCYATVKPSPTNRLIPQFKSPPLTPPSARLKLPPSFVANVHLPPQVKISSSIVSGKRSSRIPLPLNASLSCSTSSSNPVPSPPTGTRPSSAYCTRAKALGICPPIFARSPSHPPV